MAWFGRFLVNDGPWKDADVSMDEYENHFQEQIRALKESGGLGDKGRQTNFRRIEGLTGGTYPAPHNPQADRPDQICISVLRWHCKNANGEKVVCPNAAVGTCIWGLHPCNSSCATLRQFPRALPQLKDRVKTLQKPLELSACVVECTVRRLWVDGDRPRAFVWSEGSRREEAHHELLAVV